MIPSRHNILSKIHDSDAYFIVNLLSGNADILTSGEAKRFQENNLTDPGEYISKGYLVEVGEEDKLYRNRYLDFLDARDSDEIQIFYAPSYSCNFNCSYCYQDGYSNMQPGHSLETAGSFFNYVREQFRDRKKYITLFGGEPLLPANRNLIEFFVGQCKAMNIDLAVVTNGYYLAGYADLLAQAKIREIQVTLDGTESTHNMRRPLKGGEGTYTRIIQGIDKALSLDLPVNLRVVLDKDNISTLPELAQYAVDKGWTRSPHFKTQLGRNYELHHCQSQQSRLYSRIELYRDLYEMIREYPVIMKFHKPAYSVAKFLFENGDLPDPLFDSCPACKTEWAFDYTGRIYSCTATVGKVGEELGTFYPEVSLDPVMVSQWQQRDVYSIDECKTCNLRLACGGGCGSVAFNRNRNINTPDCRPVKELLELGIALYMKEEQD